jgi:hypothetical protein
MSSLLLGRRFLGSIPVDMCVPDVAVPCSLRWSLLFSGMTSHTYPFPIA